MEFKIIKLKDNPSLKDDFAKWFHEKWNIPLEAYLQSMDECLNGSMTVPQWYGAMHKGHLIAGVGVIENDFHNRKDLTPNVCAVYVENEFRNQGIAGQLLNFVCDDMKHQGIGTLYLITDHTSVYERYGWKFLCLVQGDGEPHMTRMYIHETV